MIPVEIPTVSGAVIDYEFSSGLTARQLTERINTKSEPFTFDENFIDPKEVSGAAFKTIVVTTQVKPISRIGSKPMATLNARKPVNGLVNAKDQFYTARLRAAHTCAASGLALVLNRGSKQIRAYLSSYPSSGNSQRPIKHYQSTAE